MKSFLVLIFLIVLAAIAYFFIKGKNPQLVSNTEENIAKGANTLKREVTNAITQLDAREIIQEMKKEGRVVRKKAGEIGEKLADSAADAKTTASIKSKYALDQTLSAIAISVNTTAGKVTLSGQVDSSDSVKKAMELALQTEGVREVISTLQIRENGTK